MSVIYRSEGKNTTKKQPNHTIKTQPPCEEKLAEKCLLQNVLWYLKKIFWAVCPHRFFFHKKHNEKFGSKVKKVIFAIVILKTIFLP